MWIRCRSVLCAAVVIVSGCAAVDETQASDLAAQQLTTTTPDDSAIASAPVGDEASAAYSDDWAIGVDYEGVRFVDDRDQLTLSAVTISFTGRRGVNIKAGGCWLGSGMFTWTDGRVSDWDRSLDLVLCQPTDKAVHDALLEMLGVEFFLSAEGNRLLLGSDRPELELAAGADGVEPLIHDDEFFLGFDTDVPGLDPYSVQLESQAFYVASVTMPTCQIHGGFATEPNGESILNLPPRDGQCEFSPESDQRALAFFESGPIALRDGDSITLSSASGFLTMRLAGDNDQRIEWVNVPPPPLENSDPPTRPQDPEAVRPSTPWFVERAGNAISDGVDVPVPPKWEAASSGLASAGIVGRGGIQARRLETWSPASAEVSDLEQTEGPTPVSVPTYELVDGSVVETGRRLDGEQYRFASATSFLRAIVWVFQSEEDVIVLTVSYPEFPAGSGVDGDPRHQTLTGLNPFDLLGDVRIFQ